VIRTLCDILRRFARLGSREAFKYTNGFRTWRISYEDVLKSSGSCAHYLDAQGIKKGDRIILWAENRPEWAFVFWAAVARGIQVVPLDFNSPPLFVNQIRSETEAKLIVVGDEAESSALEFPAVHYEELLDTNQSDLEPAACDPDQIVEIVYTSGTTSRPKGVVHRHRNICANLRPFGEEFQRYRLLAAPFQPVRLLNLLPLSHMFGQSMGLFISPLLGGSCVFTPEVSPPSIMETIRRERISVLVAVPRIVEQLHQYVTKAFGPAEKKIRTSGIFGVIERWLKHRDFHTAAGLKFWAIVVGGATLSEELERSWGSLGTLVIQGYGLTEASPIVALNHPFSTKPGSIGKPIKGQEVKISDEGEILIRGENVVSQYLGSSSQKDRFDSDGWLRTGDLGEYDREGNLLFKGRVDDIIITSEGLNVFPQDIERALEESPGISASVVVGREGKVHAVLLLKREHPEPNELVQLTNRKLAPHQKIKSWSIWQEEDFPRTPSTLKIDRRKVLERVSSDHGTREPSEDRPPSWLKNLLETSPKTGNAHQLKDYDLEKDLGLTSLDRIDLLSQIQRHTNTRLDEVAFSQLSSTGEIQRWLEDHQERKHKSLPSTTPRWPIWLPVGAFRDAIQLGLMKPLFHRFIDFSISGLEHLETVSPPVIFAANHTSNLDTIALVSALPYSWRSRLAPAIRQEYFSAHFQKVGFGLKDRIRSSFEYYLACAVFNTFPLSQRMEGFQRTMRYTGQLVERGYCPLVFPEGGRSGDGRIKPFKPGVAAMAIHLRVPIVPVYIGGLFEVLPPKATWPKSGRCVLRIGAPVKIGGRMDPVRAAEVLETQVRELRLCSKKHRRD
jgi:long-chain acyl-CoA synthetase